ncbi:MAG: phenylalanine--tRNA ligase subunit beta [Alphaproteobacteria bacterium]|nr:phenylalanine--tRNA ligase subunit beta [Alphaproteobacteria bacterium]
MKFTLSWLKDHLETQATLDELTTTLSAIGLEVDGLENPAEKLGAFRIARVLEAKKHPDADKLQVLSVEVAPGQKPVEVVCGAPNARAGMLAVFAPIGTYVPGLDLTLVERPVRGVVSNGMMCSAGELELAGDNEGIIDVDESLADHVGETYVSAAGLDDVVIEVGLTPNRPDCTGVRGIARDLAAAGMGTLKSEPELANVEGGYDCPVAIELEFSKDTADACPVFAGRYVKGVRNGASPAWLRQRLEAVGLRPINALVDITNYISYDRGRPLHVYDADKLQGAVHARLGKKGESFLGLDGKSYDVDETMCVIADDSGPLGLGGVLGGEETGCTETTTNVLIESAWFDPLRTAATGRKTGLVTDARYRFERGVDPASVRPGLDQATDMILKLAGGKPSRARVAGNEPKPDLKIDFDTGLVKRLTGLEIAASEIRKTLEALGCKISGKGAKLKVAVPSWRPDIHGPADLVEEVTRIAGIDTVPSTPLPRLSGVARPVLTAGQRRASRARRTLAARGLVEAVTWSFIPEQEARPFGGGAAELVLSNPISTELSNMRPSLLPGLMTAVQRNRNRGFADVGLFELGQAYAGNQPGDQLQCVSGVRAGTARMTGSGRHWNETAKQADLFDAKADVAAVLAALGLEPGKLMITRDAPNWFHPGRSGTFRLGPKVALAHFGEFHPATLAGLDVEGPLVGFEIFLNAMPGEKKKKKQLGRARPPLGSTDLMPVRRDFAFVLDAAIPAGDVLRAAQNADKKLISGVSVFDVFEGGKLAAEGKKSLAIEVSLQPTSATLTDKDIEELSAKVIAAVAKATGGEIRG